MITEPNKARELSSVPSDPFNRIPNIIGTIVLAVAIVGAIIYIGCIVTGYIPPPQLS